MKSIKPPGLAESIQVTAIIFVICGALVRAQAQDSFTNGLVAYYPFNGNAEDASGHGNDGAVIGYDWKYLGDRFGQPNSLFLNTTSTLSASLDGTYVIVPRSSSLDFNGDFTLTVWVNIPDLVYYVHNLLSNGPDTNGANFRIISHAEPGGKDYLQFVANHDTGDINSFLSPLPDTWRQVAVVRSGSNVSLFRNGSMVTNSTISSAITQSSAIWLGRHICPGYPTTCPGSYPLFGGIDDVRMYNRALSAQEILQLYQYERNPLPNLTIVVKTIRLTLFVQLGTTNQLSSSTDLKTWTPYGPPFTATNSVAYQDVDVLAGQQYFRIRLVP